MNPFSNNYNMETQPSVFANVNNNTSLNLNETFTVNEDSNLVRSHGGMLSATAPSFNRSAANELLGGIPTHQEGAIPDTVSSTSGEDFNNNMIYNVSINNPGVHIDNEQSHNNYYIGSGSQTESSVSGRSWSPMESPLQTNQTMSAFEFLVTSITTANNFLEQLSNEQLNLLRSIRPSLLYEVLYEVARVRSERRTRRVHTECAFCKNNGESEECYGSHALKDNRGRVLCPVLRAFRCPKCGATGERAHTIKYCPENIEDRSWFAGLRRRIPSSSGLLVGAANRTGYCPTIPSSPKSESAPAFPTFWTSLLTFN